MKNREFLNLIGSVNEDYIQAADVPQLHSDGAWRHDEYVGRREYCNRRTGRH